MAESNYLDELNSDIESVAGREYSVESRTIETEAMQDPNMRISDPLTIVTTSNSPGREIGASPDEAGRALQMSPRRGAEVSGLSELRPKRRKTSGYYSESKSYDQEVYQLQKEIELIKQNISTLPIVKTRTRSDADVLSDHIDAKLRLMNVLEDSPITSQSRGKHSSVSFVTDRKYRNTGDDLFALDDDISLPERLSGGAHSKERRFSDEGIVPPDLHRGIVPSGDCPQWGLSPVGIVPRQSVLSGLSDQ